MDTQQHIKTLQRVYAAVLADAALQFKEEGILDSVVQRKKQEALANGQYKAQQFGIQTPAEAFTKTVALFGCANWQIIPNDNGFTAEATACMLCALAKKMNAGNPCQLYCLHPLEGMVKGIAPGAEFTPQETLWDGQKCRVEVVTK